MGRKQAIYGFHSFRASHATLLSSGGASLGEVQSALGHTNKNTTKGYIQEDDLTIKGKLIANHQALPLAGGSAVDGIVRQLKKSLRNLNEKDSKKLLQEMQKIVTKAS